MSPGDYERSFDTFEIINKCRKIFSLHLPGREHMMVMAGMKMKYPSDDKDQFIRAVRSAWIVRRLNNPLIACVEIDNKFVYKTPVSSQEIDEWVNNSFVVATDYPASSTGKIASFGKQSPYAGCVSK